MTTTRTHDYKITVTWTGNSGSGTADYKSYSRNHEITAGGKARINGSSDPEFRGDPTRWNPEELLLASLSACHKLWFLHICTTLGLTVLSYEDHATAKMQEDKDGSGRFISATLHPHVTLSAGDDLSKIEQAHHQAHQKCFIANSVNFPIHIKLDLMQSPA